MKKRCFLQKASLLPIAFTLLLLLGVAQNLFAQVATYTLTSGTGGSGAASATGTSVNVTAGNLISGAQMQSPSYNSSGYRIKTNSLAWPTGITNDYGFDIPLSPKTNYDFTLTGITANINSQSYALSSTNLFINIYYQVDGTGAWRKLNGANIVAVSNTTTSINFGSVSESFYSGHTYLFRFYMYASAGSDKNDNYRIRDLVFNGTTSTPPAVAPTVTTGAISAITKYAANVAGSYSFGTGFRNALVSGIVWSTTTNPTVINANKTTNGSLGTINSTLTGLTAGTTYYTRAYAITQLDTVYGVQKTFTTLPPTVPSITTTAVTNVLSNKATSGGSGIDSGGYAVLEKGICWATTTGPTTANFKNNEGIGNGSFTSIMKNLASNTTYYVRAYARNTLGTGYGNEISFTTGTAVPAITAIPSTINFGNTNFAANTPSTFYVLSANYLTPAAGNLTITVPTTSPFKISLSSNGTYTNSLTVPYSANTLANTKVYVQMTTTNYGSFNSYIAHSGGGALASNTDTVFVSGSIVQDPNVLTNTGTDFWTGFGYQEKMSQKAGSSGEAKLSIYISVPSGTQNALVNVDLPGIPGASGFPKTGLSIAPNTVTEVTGFPTGSTTDEMNPTGLPDTRLYYTGISNRGIHIYSTNGVPISVWIHSYTTGNSAAGAMLFPTSTWNSSYSVQAYGGQSNNANPNSFFFVIANEDNTPIWFTPSNDILDSSSASIFSDNHVAANVKYAKGVTQGPIFLNKGQVFNAMGFIQGNGSGIGAGKATGLDLSGTTIKTNCDKKIAVFAGNGRCLINATGCSASSGSDHMIQQMFPKVAWGTKYLTVPTKTMEFNLYRINVDDPTTQVWVNNPLHTTPLTGLINNQYYEIQGSSPNIIESDKPINVTQFIVAGGCANQNGSKGNGDPEMIILSPLQQAINKTTVYSAGIKNPSASYNGHYINVIIKRAGVASFKLDNLSVADTGINQATASATTCYNTGGSISIQNAFVQHPGDTSYYYAKFKVSPLTSHTLASDYPFNAIAYGMGDGESYGYNAGTAVKNLSSINVAENPFGTDTSTTSVKTCVNNPVRLKVALPFLPYQVDSIRWDAGTDTLISPNGIKRGTLTLNTFTPAPLDSMANYDATISVEGRTYYIYSSPVLYTFKQNGTYTLKATAYGTFVSDCGSTSTSTIQVEVGQDNIAFTAVPGACGSTSVTFTDATTPMTGTTIQQWQWIFGDGQTSTSTPPNGNPVPNPHVYPPTSSGVSSYWAKLKTINSVGCYSQDSVFIDLSFNLKASFVASKDTICAGNSVTFTDQSTSNAVAWFWDWNDGTKDTVYATAPAPAISHTFNTAGTFNVKLFVKNSTGCISNIKDTNIVVIAKPVVDFQTPAGICLGGSMQFTNLSTPTTGVTYLWNFNDPAATGSNPNTSTLQNPTHIYTTSGPFNVSLTVTNTQYGCTDTKIKTLSSTIYQLPTAIINAPTSACLKDSVQFNDASTGGSGNTVTQWNWTFGDGGTSTLQNPKHAYLTTGNKTVTLVVTSDKGCTSTATTHIINIKPIPDVVHTAIPNICANAAAISITQFTESSGMTGGTWLYTGTGVSGNTFNPVTAGVGTYNIVATYTAPNGCKDNDTASITVWPLPQVNFTIGATTCEKASISFTNNSTPNSTSMQAWSWNFGDATGIVTTQNATHTYVNAGPYNVVLAVTNSNGCSNSISKPITVRNRPFASFTLPGNVCLPSGLATFTSNSTVVDDANPSHSWNFGDPNNATGSSLPVATHTYSSTGPFNVTLTITSQYGCMKDTTQVFNTIYPQPPADFTALPFEVCLGDSVKFIGQAANNAVSWSWILDDGNTAADANVTYTYTQARVYQVNYSYTDNRGCVSASVTKPVTVHALPIVDAGPQLWVLQGRTIQLQATAAGNVQNFLWQVSNAAPYLNYDTLLNPLCTPLTDEMYVLQGTGTGGCVAKDTTYVRILKTPVIPNAFSPNGDGVNDTWEIGYLNNYTGCTVEVFNRNGQAVFNSIGYSKNWDGTYKGKPLPVGTYYYVINPKSGHPVMTGYVTILK
jgi:gliding motility-associated-like protein